MVVFNRFLILVVSMASLVVPASATDANPVSVVESFVNALSRADMDALLAHVADDATFFAPLPSSPQRIDGRDRIAVVFESFFRSVRDHADGPVRMNLDHRDLEVQLLGDSAVVTFHLGQAPDEPLSRPYSFSRRTFVLHAADGEWKIVHFHGSNVTVPAQTVETETE